MPVNAKHHSLVNARWPSDFSFLLVVQVQASFVCRIITGCEAPRTIANVVVFSFVVIVAVFLFF